MKKKLLVILMSLVLCATLFAQGGTEQPKAEAEETVETSNFNPTGYPVFNEKETFKITAMKFPVHAAFNDMKVIQDWEKLTNVHIEWEQILNSAMKEKKNIIFANRNNLPDALWGSIYKPDEILNYANQGLIIPLEDLINEYGPNMVKMFEDNPEYKKACTYPDGHIYTIGGVSFNPHAKFPNKMWINEAWLEKLGLEKPTTIDELEQVLIAFRDNDLNGNGKADEIPFTIAPEGIIGFMAPWGVVADYSVHDGKVQCDYLTEGFRQGISWFAKLNDEGLLDGELFTQNPAQQIAKGSGPDARYGFFTRSSHLQLITSENEKQYGAVEALEGPAGKWIYCNKNGFNQPIRFIITKACRNPEALIRWIDYVWTTEGYMNSARGPEGEGWRWNDDGSVEYLDAPEGMNFGVWRNGMCPGGTTPGGLPMDQELRSPASDQRLGQICAEMYEPYAAEFCLPNITYTIEEGQERIKYVTTIDKYVKESVARFITGNLDIDGPDYDKFIEDLHKMGVDRVVEINQAAVDRYNAL